MKTIIYQSNQVALKETAKDLKFLSSFITIGSNLKATKC
nr:MAG TPA: hypothetical protein [Caudoviricetes sp.]